MTTYQYQGKNRQHQTVSGEIEASHESDCRQKLKGQGIIVTRLTSNAGYQAQWEAWLIKAGVGQPKLQDLLLFSRQMYTLVKSGVPIVRAIFVIQDAIENKALKKALGEISQALEGGKSLSVAMSDQKNIFPNLMLSMVQVGENTGNLDEAFLQIANYIDNEMITRKRIKSAMRYPMFVTGAIVVAIMVINIFVIPAFSDFFVKFGGQLPLPTRILMATSNFTVAYWPVLLIGLIGIIMGISWYKKTEAGELLFARWSLKMPLVGKILNKALLARFSRSLAMSIRAGVPMLQALTVVSSAVDNAYVADKILGMRQQLERGDSLTRSAMSAGLFTNLVIQMIAIGEETGDVDSMLQEVADSYERDVDYDLKGLSEAIEPILISVIAVIVLILALGIFLPMWDLSSVALK